MTTAAEYKVVALRECPTPDEMAKCHGPDEAVAYWRANVATAPWFNPGQECAVVLLLNTRRRIMGHNLSAIGTVDGVHTHPRDIFRTAIVANATFIIFMHNHPSGDPTPSDADIKITRDLARAGELLRLELTDSIVVGHPNFVSLKNLGYLLR
jgi:DNA repair protein RadC